MTKFLTFQIVLVALLAATYGKVALPYRPMLDGRIVGGENANIEDFPHQILLEYLGSHRCGGSIISKNIVLTAAHCIDGLSPSSITIRAGSSINGEGGTVITAKQLQVHEQYYNLDYDVGLIFLEQDLQFSKGIQAIDLPDEEDVPDPGTIATVTGWGATSSGGPTSSRLQKVEVPIVDQNKCASAYGSSVTPRMICAGVLGVGGKDSCQGDSGGPMAINGKVQGIVSWGSGCASPNYPGVYTRVTALRQWIKEKSGL